MANTKRAHLHFHGLAGKEDSDAPGAYHCDDSHMVSKFLCNNIQKYANDIHMFLFS